MSTVANRSISSAPWLPSGTATELSGAEEWFVEQQQAAQRIYAELGLPGVRDEQWRYTNLRSLKNAEFEFARPVGNTPTLDPAIGVRLVFVNGFLNQELSTLEGLPKGATINRLSEALTEQSQLLQPLVGSTLPAEQHGFHLMNTAFSADGFVLVLEKGCVVDQAIEVVFSNTNGMAAHTRNMIVAGANSQCTIIERHSGEQGASYLNNCITEVIANDGANVDHYKLHAESDDAFHVGGLFIQQQRNAQVSSHNINLSGGLVRNDITAQLLGQGSHVEMNGLVLGTGKQHVDNHTEVVHAVANCTSDEFYKTVLDDQSRSIFRGRIVVAQDAQQTNADQQNNNLLLSGTAEADTKPQLEIYADDVKCSHGATVGQLEQKSMFYLQSRGINPADARALLTFAFANEVVERVKVESIRDELTKLIAGELVSDLEGLL